MKGLAGLAPIAVLVAVLAFAPAAHADIKALEEGDLRPDQVKLIATRLGVTEEDVVSMNRRLAGDSSLNAPVRNDAESGEWQDWLVDESESPETEMDEREELTGRKGLLANALKTLSERERHILVERRLKDNPTTLEDLSQHYDISRERVRQIELESLRRLAGLREMQVVASP